MEASQPADLHPAAGTPLTDATGRPLSRRSFLAGAAGGFVALRQRHPVNIGVQSYSFRDRSLDEAIAAMRRLGLTSCELWRSPAEPHNRTRAERRRWRDTINLDYFHRVRDRFTKASIALSAYNISFRDDFSEAEIERGFEMAEGPGAAPLPPSS